jgi:catechol 2,3-dioxygenase-like lactoylglutathione lyase family enzyme
MKRTVLGCVLALGAAMPAMAQPAMPSVPTLVGVKIGVADFQRTIPFYTALGLHAGTRYNDHEMSLEWNGDDQGVRIIMVHDDKGRFARGGGFMMIAVPDMAATLARLGAAGFTGLGQPRAVSGASMLVVRDPDGNQVELLGPPAR